MKNIFSVGQINRYVKNMFTQDFILQKIYVKGEVSNCKYHTSGHIYFSLKDETGVLSCVMFAGHRRGLAFRMKDGDRVVVGGAPAKVLRELEEKDIYAWERSKQTYIDLAARCKAPGGLKRID